MLQAVDVKKSYDTVDVLRGVTVEIGDAEVVSIVGASGAGKSTLLHILGTLDLPDSGDVLFDGNLAHRLHHKPSEMSGGEQQRTSVSRALINSPKIVFADEPSGNLDPKNASELHEIFFRLRDEMQQTFVIVTHNDELAAMTDRRIVMKDGVLAERAH